MGKKKLYAMSHEELLKECIMLQRKNYLLEQDINTLKHEKQQLEYIIKQMKEN